MEAPRTSSTTRRFRFVHRLTLTLILLFLVFMAVIGIAWHVMNPNEPGFRVSSLSVSNFTLSDSKLRERVLYDIGLTIRNPNKKIEVVLDNFVVSVCYGGVELSRGTVQKISLGKMSEKNLKIEIVMKNSQAQKKLFGDLGKDWSKGVVNFNVKMKVRIRFKAGIWPTRLKLLYVYCGDLDVGFFSPKDTGKLLGIGKDCHVNKG